MTTDQPTTKPATASQTKYLGYLLATLRETGTMLPYLPVEHLGKQAASDWITWLEERIPEDKRRATRDPAGAAA